VLVVDDDPAMGRAIRRVLGPSYEVVVSTDAAEALEYVRGGERFDVVLCDLMMPDVGGPAFFEALKRMAPPMAERVVFLTGGAFTDRAREFLRSVPNERVEKPFDPGSLHRAIARYVR
jgi:CheY-like chemotaxis protein